MFTRNVNENKINFVLVTPVNSLFSTSLRPILVFNFVQADPQTKLKFNIIRGSGQTKFKKVRKNICVRGGYEISEPKDVVYVKPKREQN